jgi:DNA-binding response OmpR family regulator
MEHAGQALHRHNLLDRVWGEDWVGDPRTLDVHICWLRGKLEDEPAAARYIETVRGHGYRFVEPVGGPAATA